MNRLTTIACVLTLGGFMSVDNQASAEKTVRVGVLTVYSTKSTGASWDVGEGAPDLKVTIRVKKFSSASKTTSVKQNTYSTEFGEDTVSIEVGNSVEINVWDKDVLSDDFIGGTTLVIDADELRNGGVRLNSFGRVRSLTLFFR